MKAVLLVGGFGTRLKHLLPNVPKPMADIAGRPFLEYLLDYLIDAGIDEAILSVHYLKDKIIEHFGDKYKNIKITYAVENEPLGTGGAILNSVNSVKYDGKFIVLNGDSFQKINIKEFYDTNRNNNLSVVLRRVNDTARYGRVEVDNKKITSFREKGITGEGLINAGCYLIDSNWFKNLNLPDKFSIEADFLTPYLNKIDMPYYIADDYFIDIGIPEDYARAQVEIPAQAAKPCKALFLDRDGVINIDTDYTHKIEDITFIDGIFELVKEAKNKGHKIFIITNQAGIGRGIYSEEQYQVAKNYIEENFKKHGTEVTRTYHCPYHPEFGVGDFKVDSPFRKPNPGMILQAKQEFNIDLENSVLIGDRESDIEAGINAGIKTKILFRPKKPDEKTKADFITKNLLDIKRYL